MKTALKVLIYAIVGVIAIKVIILIIGLVFVYKTYNEANEKLENDREAKMEAMEEAAKQERLKDSIWQKKHQH